MDDDHPSVPVDSPDRGSGTATNDEASTDSRRPGQFWTRGRRHDPRRPLGGFAGSDLAALRRGLSRGPGEEPAVWPYYSCLDPTGRVTPALRAEHLALGLFGVHQQSRTDPMHVPPTRTGRGNGLGAAALVLRGRPGVSADALDARFAALAGTHDLTPLAQHLRSLITRLNHERVPLDYTQLWRDLCDWQDESRRGRVRRRWGSQYYAPPRHDDVEESDADVG